MVPPLAARRSPTDEFRLFAESTFQHLLRFSNPIRLSGHIYRIGFMAEPVNQCGTQNLVLDNLFPSGKRQIGCYDNGTCTCTYVYHIEK